MVTLTIPFASAESKQFQIWPRTSGASSPFKVWIQADDATSSPGAQPNTVAWASAKAVIKFNINGKDLVLAGHDVSTVPVGKIDGIVADANGIVTGGTYTFTKDTKVPDFLHSGVAASIANGAKVSINIAAPFPLGFTGGMKLVLPFKGDSTALDGSQKKDANIEVDLTDVKLNGAGLDFSATAKSVKFGAVQASIEVTSPDVKVSIPSAPNTDATFDFHASQAIASVSSPTAASVGDSTLSLTVNELHVDADSLVTFQQATFEKGDPANPDSWPSVKLASPVDFSLLIRKATIKMTGSSFDTFSVDDGMVELPSQFSSTDKSSGTPKRVQIPFSGEDLSKNAVITLKSPSSDLNIYWNSFHLSIPKAAAIAVLDLSDATGSDVENPIDPATSQQTKLPASWQGMYIPAYNLEVPSFLESDTSKPILINGTGFYIDGSGISGTFITSSQDPAKGIAGTQVPSFAGSRITDLKLVLTHSHLNEGSAKGALVVSDWGVNLKVDLSYADSGTFTVGVSTQDPVPVPALGLKLKIDQGTFTFGRPQNGGASASLVISGSLQFPDDIDANSDFACFKGGSFSVKDLAIDSTGHIGLKSAWLDLPNATPIDFGPAKILVNQLGVGVDDTKGSFIAFSGDVSLGPDLPISGQIGFQGLYIYSKAKGADGTFGAGFPDVSLKGIDFSTSIPGVLSISGHLTNDKFPKLASGSDTNSLPAGHPWKGKPQVTVLNGGADVQVDALKAMGGLGIDLNFMVAPGSFALSGFTPVNPPIQLGQTPFAIRAFGGGFGVNVYGGDPTSQAPIKMVGKPGRDYTIYPLPGDYSFPAGGVGNRFLGTAGIRLATSDGFTAFGDGTVTFGAGGASFVDLDAMLYLAQLGVGDETPAQDRTLHGNLHYDFQTETFTANLAANMYVPTKDLYKTSKKGAYVHGSMDLKLSPTDCHVYIGGPITEDSNHRAPKIENPVGFEVFGIQGPSGAFTIDYNFQNPDQLLVQAGAKFAYQTTFGPYSWAFLSASGAVSADAYLYGNLQVSNGWSNINARGYVHVDGTVDVTASAFGQSATAHATVDADLAGSFNVHLKDSPPTFDIAASGRLDVSFDLLGYSKKISQEVKFPL